MNLASGGFYLYVLRSLIACCRPHLQISRADANGSFAKDSNTCLGLWLQKTLKKMFQIPQTCPGFRRVCTIKTFYPLNRDTSLIAFLRSPLRSRSLRHSAGETILPQSSRKDASQSPIRKPKHSPKSQYPDLIKGLVWTC